MCCIIWRWYAHEPSWCKVLHTYIRDTPVLLEFLLVPSFLVLLPEHHLLYAAVVHVLHSFVGKNQFPLQFCVRFRTLCNVEHCDVGCKYSGPAALPFPVQKLYTTCMLAYSSFVKLFGIVISPPHCNTTQPLTTTVYKQNLYQRTALLAPSNRT
jgi:hypothetical protein